MVIHPPQESYLDQGALFDPEVSSIQPELPGLDSFERPSGNGDVLSQGTYTVPRPTEYVSRTAEVFDLVKVDKLGRAHRPDGKMISKQEMAMIHENQQLIRDYLPDPDAPAHQPVEEDIKPKDEVLHINEALHAADREKRDLTEGEEDELAVVATALNEPQYGSLKTLGNVHPRLRDAYVGKHIKVDSDYARAAAADGRVVARLKEDVKSSAPIAEPAPAPIGLRERIGRRFRRTKEAAAMAIAGFWSPEDERERRRNRALAIGAAAVVLAAGAYAIYKGFSTDGGGGGIPGEGGTAPGTDVTPPHEGGSITDGTPPQEASEVDSDAAAETDEVEPWQTEVDTTEKNTITHSIQDRAGKCTLDGGQIWRVYLGMEAAGYITPEHITGVGLYEMADGHMGYSGPGTATFDPEAVAYMDELIREELEKAKSNK